MVAMLNGFTVLPYGSAKLGTFAIGNTGVKLSLRRELAPLAVRFCVLFNAEVERLHPGWCWGHSPRRIGGTNVWSQHAMGGAWDLNAPLHPMGKHNTFSPGERKRIHELLDDEFRFKGVRLIRWGADYTGRKDDMHFEVIAPRATVLRAVAALQAPAKPRPKPPAGRHEPGSRLLQAANPDMTGDDVRYVQKWIGPEHCGPADGVLGDRSVRGIRWYQQYRGIKADGVVGRVTWAHMRIKATF